MSIFRALARAIFPFRERRAVDRLPIPTCPACHTSERVKVKTRTDYSVHFRCRLCGELIVISKPRL